MACGAAWHQLQQQYLGCQARIGTPGGQGLQYGFERCDVLGVAMSGIGIQSGPQEMAISGFEMQHTVFVNVLGPSRG